MRRVDRLFQIVQPLRRDCLQGAELLDSYEPAPGQGLQDYLATKAPRAD
jgi:hypothetical protein